MPTGIRHRVIGATTLVAVILYLDRICIAEIAKLDSFKESLSLNEEQTGAILSAFFFTYALGQVPAGWLSDRFGARRMLPLYIGIWSLCTILTGLASGFAMLIAARMFFGLAQAGCYPTAGSLIKRWVPLPRRGTASSLVSFGGRFGGAVAPLLTAWLLKDHLGWRAVLVLYGCAGFVVAGLFWTVFRETPAEHPDCDDDERRLIAAGETDASAAGPVDAVLDEFGFVPQRRRIGGGRFGVAPRALPRLDPSGMLQRPWRRYRAAYERYETLTRVTG